MVPAHIANPEPTTPHTGDNMDLRDYIHGDDSLKELGAQNVIAASVVFAVRIVDIFREYMDDVPDAMRVDMAEAVDMFMSGVGEFVDMDALMEAFGEG